MIHPTNRPGRRRPPPICNQPSVGHGSVEGSHSPSLVLESMLEIIGARRGWSDSARGLNTRPLGAGLGFLR